MKARFFTAAVNVECPQCAGSIAAPDNGSHLWPVAQFNDEQVAGVFVCEDCGCDTLLPKRLRDLLVRGVA